MMSFLKMMLSWRHNPPKIYYEVIILKYEETIIMNKTVFGRNLVRKQSVQLMLCKNRRK